MLTCLSNQFRLFLLLSFLILYKSFMNNHKIVSIIQKLRNKFITFSTLHNVGSNNNKWYSPTQIGRLCGGDYVIVKCADKSPFQRLFESSSSDSAFFSKIVSNSSQQVVLLEEEMKIGLGQGTDRITNPNRLNTFLGGRVALREAIRKATGSDEDCRSPVLKNSLGGPLLSSGLTGYYYYYYCYYSILSFIITI
jgi:hypothetical protein